MGRGKRSEKWGCGRREAPPHPHFSHHTPLPDSGIAKYSRRAGSEVGHPGATLQTPWGRRLTSSTRSRVAPQRGRRASRPWAGTKGRRSSPLAGREIASPHRTRLAKTHSLHSCRVDPVKTMRGALDRQEVPGTAYVPGTRSPTKIQISRADLPHSVLAREYPPSDTLPYANCHM